MVDNKGRYFCSCEKETGLDICDKCRESVNAPGYDDIYKNHFKEKAKKVAETEKHFGHIEGCEPLMSHAIDEAEFDAIDKAIQAGEITPITQSRILRLGAMTLGLRPRRESTPQRVVIDIDPACPYVLVRFIVGECNLDKP